MPAYPVRILIVFLWAASLAWWFVREVAPRWHSGKLDYRQLLGQRASDEPTVWHISVDGKKVGSINANVQPMVEGGFTLRSHATMNAMLLPGFEATPQVLVGFRADVSPFGKLKAFEVRVALDNTAVNLYARGTVEDDVAVVTLLANQTPIGEPRRIPLDPTAPIGHSLAPIDKLPGLWIGRSWTTRMMDPQALVASGTPFGGSAPTAKEVLHRVLGEDRIEWASATHLCFVVEDRVDGLVGKTWVRQADGQVLRQEAVFGASKVTMELDPASFRLAR